MVSLCSTEQIINSPGKNERRQSCHYPEILQRPSSALHLSAVPFVLSAVTFSFLTLSLSPLMDTHNKET